MEQPITKAMNRYGVVVRRWCASCQHKVVSNQGTRACELMNIKVERDFVCPKWKMMECLWMLNNKKTT